MELTRSLGKLGSSLQVPTTPGLLKCLGSVHVWPPPALPLGVHVPPPATPEVPGPEGQLPHWAATLYDRSF